MSWMEYRTLWDGVSVALILRLYSERVEAKKAFGLKVWLGCLRRLQDRKEYVRRWP
jgi:hypothetical protein